MTIKSGVELVDCRRDPQPGLEHNLLSLESDVLGPSNESGQISGGLDILTNSKVSGSLLKQRVDHSLDLLPLDSKGGCCNLLSLSLLAFLVDHLDLGYEYNLKCNERLIKLSIIK